MADYTPRVLITGGGRGIGRAIAERLASEGADVAVADINKDIAEQTAEALARFGHNSLALHTDVTDTLEVKSMVARTVEALGAIDVFFNNAGIIKIQPFLDVTESDWDEVLNVNLKGVFLCGQAVARQMLQQDNGDRIAKIINTASVASRVGIPDMGPYAASKAGVMSLTRTMALSLAAHGITVNALAPGIVTTDMWEQIDAERAQLEGVAKGEPVRQRIASIPLGRPAVAEDIANVASFLAGPDSNYMTGQTLNIDGGARPS